MAREFTISGVILESPTLLSHLLRLRQRIRRLGPSTVLGQALFQGYDRLFLRRRAAPWVRLLESTYGTPPAHLAWHPVRSINSKEALRILTDGRPAVIVVTGTSILRKRTLQAAPLFLNIHCGITPAYRGVHGAFWAILNRDWDNVGVSVHRVDAGVDTGGIVAQSRILVDPLTDSFRTLVFKQYAEGIPLMVRAVRDALDGTLRSFRRSDLPSRQWYTPTIPQYRQFLRALRSTRDGPGTALPDGRASRCGR